VCRICAIYPTSAICETGAVSRIIFNRLCSLCAIYLPGAVCVQHIYAIYSTSAICAQYIMLVQSVRNKYSFWCIRCAIHMIWCSLCAININPGAVCEQHMYNVIIKCARKLSSGAVTTSHGFCLEANICVQYNHVPQPLCARSAACTPRRWTQRLWGWPHRHDHTHRVNQPMPHSVDCGGRHRAALHGHWAGRIMGTPDFCQLASWPTAALCPPGGSRDGSPALRDVLLGRLLSGGNEAQESAS
jgi:hypothetical protein